VARRYGVFRVDAQGRHHVVVGGLTSRDEALTYAERENAARGGHVEVRSEGRVIGSFDDRTESLPRRGRARLGDAEAKYWLRLEDSGKRGRAGPFDNEHQAYRVANGWLKRHQWGQAQLYHGRSFVADLANYGGQGVPLRSDREMRKLGFGLPRRKRRHVGPAVRVRRR